MALSIICIGILGKLFSICNEVMSLLDREATIDHYEDVGRPVAPSEKNEQSSSDGKNGNPHPAAEHLDSTEDGSTDLSRKRPGDCPERKKKNKRKAHDEIDAIFARV